MSSFLFFFFKQKTAYEMRISDWSSDVCSSDLQVNIYDQEHFMQILHIDSSISGDNSATRALSAAIVAELVAANPGASVAHRDLAAEPLEIGRASCRERVCQYV